MSPGASLLAQAALGTLPGLAWLLYFYLQDRYQPEPPRLILGTFALGGLMVLPAAGLEARLLPLVTGGTSLVGLDLQVLALGTLLVVGPVEELLKFAAAWLSVAHSPEFDEPVDGVVYATAAALGFSTVENIWYMATTSSSVLLGRSVFSCLLHASTSGLVGYAWGQARFLGKPRSRIAGALAAAILLHAGYDFLAFGGFPQALVGMGALLILADAVLTVRISRALRASPFRPDDEGGAAPPPAPDEAAPPAP